MSDDSRSLKLSLAVYVVVFAMKLGVYFLTGVMALMAEAFHTLSDIFVSAFLLIAVIYSRKAPDEEHAFGHGRAQNAASLVAATLFVAFTSFRLYEEAIPRLFSPAEVTYQNLELAAGVLVASMLIAAAPLVQLIRQKERGPAARAQLLELVNDELGLLAALIGTGFIALGMPLADPIASLVVATIIAYNGVQLFRDNLSYLIGRSPGREYLAEVERLALSVPGVLGAHDLRAEFVGPAAIHAGLHIEVRRGLPIEEADRIATEVEQRVHQEPHLGYCTVHVDPAREPQAEPHG